MCCVSFDFNIFLFIITYSWALLTWRNNVLENLQDRQEDQAAIVHYNRQLLHKVRLRHWGQTQTNQCYHDKSFMSLMQLSFIIPHPQTPPSPNLLQKRLIKGKKLNKIYYCLILKNIVNSTWGSYFFLKFHCTMYIVLWKIYEMRRMICFKNACINGNYTL